MIKKKPKKRRTEIMHPGLKQLTPHENKIVANHGIEVLEMWKKLYARNKWTPSRDGKTANPKSA